MYPMTQHSQGLGRAARFKQIGKSALFPIIGMWFVEIGMASRVVLSSGCLLLCSDPGWHVLAESIDDLRLNSRDSREIIWALQSIGATRDEALFRIAKFCAPHVVRLGMSNFNRAKNLRLQMIQTRRQMRTCSCLGLPIC
jgi:hypothetical protein